MNVCYVESHKQNSSCDSTSSKHSPSQAGLWEHGPISMLPGQVKKASLELELDRRGWEPIESPIVDALRVR